MVTNVLSKLLFVATNDTLSPADLNVLTTAVTNQLAERAEDLQCVVLNSIATNGVGREHNLWRTLPRCFGRLFPRVDNSC